MFALYTFVYRYSTLCTHMHMYAYVYGGCTHVCIHVDMHDTWKPIGILIVFVIFCICVCTLTHVCVITV